MKTGAIFRIIIGSLVAVTLTVVLAMTLTGNHVVLQWLTGRNHDNSFSAKSYASQSDGEKGGAIAGQNAPVGEIVCIDPAQVRELSINWVAGEVTLRAGDVEQIEFYESAGRPLTDAQTLRFWMREGKLSITFCESTQNAWKWLDIDKLNMPAKALSITVPQSMVSSLKELEINSVSADVEVLGVGGDEVKLETVSGDADIQNAACTELKVSTVSGKATCSNVTASDFDGEAVSGNFKASGAFSEIDVDTVSGSIEVRTSVSPREVEGGSVSGNISLYLPKDSGFTAKIDTVSGEIECSLPCTVGKNRVICGNGSAAFDFESVSGSVRILAID